MATMWTATLVVSLLQGPSPAAPPDSLPPGRPAVGDTAGAAAPDSLAGGTAARPDTSAAAARDSVGVARADTTARPRRVVREFPAVEVRALLHDARSSQTVREIPVTALRAYPADGLADLVALQPGVVAHEDELHVRGGRAGETRVVLDGVTLNEPLRNRPMELPLLALRSVELVSGAPESRHAGALAGVLELHTMDPADRAEAEWRWQSDAGLSTRFDRVSARVSTPLRLIGLGVVAAGDATLDDTTLPALRTAGRRDLSGFSFGWRAENRMLGYLKLAPVAGSRRFSAQVLASRTVRRPYDPAWSLEGWTGFDPLLGLPDFSPVPLPGYARYRAADHKAMTDERRQGVLLTAAGMRGERRGTLALGFMRTRSATSIGGGHTIPADPVVPSFDSDLSGDPFHVIGGDDPIYRVGGSDVWSLRGDAEFATRRGAAIRVGLGASYEEVWQDELDATLLYNIGVIDSVRSYHAWAPGAFAYAQGRWQTGDMVVNAGLRAEYYTAGPQAEHQTLPGSPTGRVALLPRIGLAYPLSSRSVFSMSYTRVSQPPERDLLYDRRRVITNRQPLGNPALRPMRMISYEAAVKHLLHPEWAFQASVFYRDVAFLPGARDYRTGSGPVDLRYTDEDQASTAGFELTLVRDVGERRRVEAHYTFMRAWGYESRPEGDPYGPLREVSTAPISEQPLSWDRRHTLVVSGVWRWGSRLSVAGSSSLGSPLPWTPKPRREPPTDVTQVNTRRFGWTAVTHLGVTWTPPYALGLTFGFEARNLFDDRSERLATVDGFPNPVINTYFDDYGAYRTETGLGGGAYWTNAGGTGHWVPVHDERLLTPSRTLRASVGRSW